VVGVFATNHKPQVLPPYFAARKNEPCSTTDTRRVKQITLTSVPSAVVFPGKIVCRKIIFCVQ
jgi:hypothetical protein